MIDQKGPFENTVQSVIELFGKHNNQDDLIDDEMKCTYLKPDEEFEIEICGGGRVRRNQAIQHGDKLMVKVDRTIKIKNREINKDHAEKILNLKRKLKQRRKRYCKNQSLS